MTMVGHEEFLKEQLELKEDVRKLLYAFDFHLVCLPDDGLPIAAHSHTKIAAVLPRLAGGQRVDILRGDAEAVLSGAL